MNVAQMMISVVDRVKNSVEKGENDTYQHFLLLPQFFDIPSSLRCVRGVNPFPHNDTF